MGRGREDDREHSSQFTGEERNRSLEREGRYGQGGYGDEGSHEYEGSRGGYGGGSHGDYGPGAFNRQFRGGTEYFGTAQRGYGTTSGGGSGELASYSGGQGGYSGGVGIYGEQGRYVGRGPKGYQRSDGRILEDICERLTQHPEIDAVDIEIQVKNGEVTLTGTVERRQEKRMAEDVSESVSGVKDVHNQLRIRQNQGVQAGQGTQGIKQETATKTK